MFQSLAIAEAVDFPVRFMSFGLFSFLLGSVGGVLVGSLVADYIFFGVADWKKTREQVNKAEVPTGTPACFLFY